MTTNGGDPEKQPSQATLDTLRFVVQNSGREIVFARSATRHRISRAVIRAVVADPLVVARLRATEKSGEAVLFLGSDRDGKPLEIIAVELETGLLVIHAMPLRKKWLYLYRLCSDDE